MLISSGTQAQNLFEAHWGSGNIYEFAPYGAQSTFASGLDYCNMILFGIFELISADL